MTNKRNPPGPASIFSLPVYIDLFRDPLSFLTKVSRQYGDIVYMRLGSRRDYLLNHPDLIQKAILSPEILERSTSRVLRQMLGRGLLTTDMESHSEQKRYLQPAFHKQRINEYAAIMFTIARNLSRQWEGKTTIDVAREMNHLALDIVVKTLLGSEGEKEEEDIVEALETIKDLTDQKKSAFIDALLSRLPLPRSARYWKARACLDRRIYEIIKKKRAANLNGHDLVTTLLLAQDSPQACPFLSDTLVRDEVMTMFAAGHETIASAMTWTWYLLSQNPDVEEKLHDEVDQVLGADSALSPDLSRLVYTKKVFLESMRLYPPVWLIVRHPVKDVEIGGYAIPAGSYVHLCQYLMHHDPRYFPNPEKFDPERWTPEAASMRPKFCYFPFGGGKRICIGEAFAMTEGIIVIAALAQKWRLRRVSHNAVELEPMITLRPKNGLPMKLQKRSVDVRHEYTVPR